MSSTTALKLEYPKIADTREFIPEIGQKEIQMIFDCTTVRIGTMVRHPELRYESRKGVTGSEFKTPTTSGGEGLYFSPDRRGHRFTRER